MLRYSSSRHRQLMTESEYALQDASESPVPRESRIASTVLSDIKKYREWELRHANLLLPVAEQSARKYQVLALRHADIALIHRRALFQYLQTHEVRGELRERLFRLFHTTLDFNEAILAEHRQYMLAFSSGISTHHIIDIMRDDTSTHLVQQYETTFARYFEMKCFVATARDSDTVKIVRSSLRDVQGHLLRLRRRMETELPTERTGNFDRQELLARSGRYEIQNYLKV
ncbi:MAG: hypothetical protein OEO71_08770 [Gammaproteobacteria bacterium]|nr:hypothetical protein [Gammaproteobacteria bacterium]